MTPPNGFISLYHLVYCTIYVFFTILIYHINLGWLMIGCISLYHLHLRTRCLVPRYLWNPLRNFKKKQRTHIDTNNGIMMNFKQEQRRCIVCIVLQVDAPCLPGFCGRNIMYVCIYTLYIIVILYIYYIIYIYIISYIFVLLSGGCPKIGVPHIIQVIRPWLRNYATALCLAIGR